MAQLFDSCTSIQYLNLSNFKTSSVNNMLKMFNNCKSLLSLDISNFHLINNLFIDDMFNGVSYLNYTNMFNLYAEKTILFNLFSQIPGNSSICINEQKVNMFEIISNLKKCIIFDCSGDFNTTQKKMLENDNCINGCNLIENKYKYKGKCYNICPNETISSSYDEFICINKTKEDINNEKKFSSMNIFTNKNFPNIYKEPSNTIKIINAILNDIQTGLMNLLLLNIMEKKEDLIVNYLNTKYQLTTSYNQDNNEYNNISSIHLGNCENILKEKYKISKNETLIILKLDYFIEGITIPIITYEIINPKNYENLDLKFCNKEIINYNIPIPPFINEENIFLHDPNNSYYKDICISGKSESGPDITLYDRKNDYNIKNMSLCENHCIFQGYNQNSKKVLCSCDINNKSPLSLEDIIDKKKFLNNFINFKSISNIAVVKCYKLLFSKEGLAYNIGSYILLSIIFLIIISCIYFIINGYKNINNKILNIISKKKEMNKNNNNENIYKKIKQNGNDKNKRGNIDNISKKKIQFNEDINQIKSVNKLINLSQNINKKENFEESNNINTKTLDSITYYNDFEINDLPYEEAVKKDTRTFFQNYISLLKTNHLLFLSFYPNKDYNSKIIKICLFFFSFALYLSVNTLFFNDSTMHKLYENKGAFDFVYFIPSILYSNIICIIINKIIKILSLSEKNIAEFKQIKDINEREKQLQKLIKCLLIKFSLFFILTLLFLSLFWYYVSCFCIVYKNTQINLIKDTLFSFGLALLYPFVLCLIKGILRIYLLKKAENFLELFFKISKILT